MFSRIPSICRDSEDTFSCCPLALRSLDLKQPDERRLILLVERDSGPEVDPEPAAAVTEAAAWLQDRPLGECARMSPDGA
jgi:hypothetical protein